MKNNNTDLRSRDYNPFAPIGINRSYGKLVKLVDTNVLIDYYEDIMKKGMENTKLRDDSGSRSVTRTQQFRILSSVIEEIDVLEKETRDNELKYTIRKAKNALREMVDNPKDYPGISLFDVSETNLEEKYDYVDDLIVEGMNQHLFSDEGDKIVLLTGDTILYVRAKMQNLEVEFVEKNKSKETYRELRYNPVVTLNPEEHPGSVATIYQDGRLPSTVEMVNGQYLEIEDLNGTVQDQFRHEDGELIKIYGQKMRVKDFTTVKPKNSRQNLLLDLLDNEDKPVKLITGAQGVGKTYFSLLYAYRRLLEEQKRIVWMRPTVYVRGTQDIGALPGDLDEKLEVMYAPAKDILTEDIVYKLVEDGHFCVEHLGYDRGRSFTNATILIPECQNLTEDNVHFVLGRVGEGSEIIFDGDYMQSDIGHPSGLLALDNKLAGNELFGKVELPETVRSDVAKLTQLFEQ